MNDLIKSAQLNFAVSKIISTSSNNEGNERYIKIYKIVNEIYEAGKHEANKKLLETVK